MSDVRNITFSQQFYDLLKNVVKVAKPGRTVFYKQSGRCRMTIPGQSTLLHISAGPSDFNFDGDRINLLSLEQFSKFADAINYPTTGNITLENEISVRGLKYEYIKFNASSMCCRTCTADPSLFTRADLKIPAPREVDKTPRVAELAFNDESLKNFARALKLVPDCKFVTLAVGSDDVRIYCKGKTSQQVTYNVDETNYRNIEPRIAALAFNEARPRMFTTTFFGIMKGIGGNYTVDVRYIKNETIDTVILKAFSDIVGADATDPIKLFVGSTESAAAAMTNYDFIA